MLNRYTILTRLGSIVLGTSTSTASSTSTTTSTTSTSSTSISLSYPSSGTITFVVNTQNSSAPTIVGNVTSCSSNPSLPSGLSIDQTACVISGTPTSTQTSTPYVITASNGVASTTANITITINIAPPSNLSYPSSGILNFTINTAGSFTPTVVGTVSSCTISPGLPAGLSISNVTCMISGTPTVAIGGTSYTVTATNSYGSTTASITIIVSGLVRQYSFTSGSYLDQNSSNTLTQTGTPAQTVGKDGETNGAYYFNGSSQYLSGSITGLSQGSFSRTLCAWVSPAWYPSSGNSITIMSYGTIGSGQSFGLNLYNNSGTQQVVLSTTGNDLSANYNLPLNSWSHLCAVYDGATAQLFINGNLQASASKSYSTGSTYFSIGSLSGVQYFRGKIDDVRFYSNAQTATQIKLFAIQVPSGLVAYYPFDNDTNDYSGSGNNGTIFGTVTSVPDRFGNANSAYSNNGINGSYVRASDAALPMGTNSRTMCMWYRSNNNNLGIAPIIYGTSGANQFAIWFQSNNLVRSWGQDINITFGTGAISDYIWRHICITNNAGATGQVYVNGVMVGSAAQAIITTSNTYLYMGSYVTSREDAGTMDDVRVYNRVLTASEVKALSGYHPFQTSVWNLTPGTSNIKLQFEVSSVSNLSNGASVNTWVDTSGVGNNVTTGIAPNYSTSGINGKPSVNFIRSSGHYLQNGGATGTSGAQFGWFTVFQATTFPGNYLFSIGSTCGNDKNLGVTSGGILNGGACNIISTGSPSSISTNTPYIGAYTYNGVATSNLYLNGLFLVSQAGAGTSVNDGLVNIGRRANAGAGSEFDGFISEVYFFNSVPSISDLTLMNCYFSSKYNIALDVSVVCP